MRSFAKKITPLDKITLAIVSILIFSVAFQACRKTDFSSTVSKDGFIENFFTTKGKVSPRIQSYIQILERENARHNFVNALPHDIGRPVWEKALERQLTNTAAKDDSDAHYIVVPFAPTGTYIRGLLIAVPADSGYIVNYYGTEFLYAACHAANKNISQAENLLALFMLMDNYIFGRQDFYHIPTDLFPTNARDVSADSTKTASMKAILGGGDENTIPKNCVIMPTGLHHDGEEGNCDWPDGCGMCSYMYCVFNAPDFPELPPTGGGSGYPDPPPAPPSNPPPGGGGSGGGTCSTCPPLECKFPFYVEDPCPTTPPIPPFNPYIAASVGVDTSISNNFPCFSKILDSISLYANANAMAQVILHDVFNINKRIHITFEADRTMSNSIDGITNTDSATVSVNPDGSEGIDFYAKVQLNFWMLQHATQEYIASVILHETIHAYINYKGEQYRRGAIDSTTFKNLFPLFWPFKQVGRFYNSSVERYQHEGMARNYITLMGRAISGVSVNPYIRTSLRDSVYEALSWGGLDDTKVWNNKTDTAYINGFLQVMRDTSLRVPLNVPGFPGYFNEDSRTLHAKAYCQ